MEKGKKEQQRNCLNEEQSELQGLGHSLMDKSACCVHRSDDLDSIPGTHSRKKKARCQNGEMTEVKVLATDDLSLVPRTNMVEGEKSLLQYSDQHTRAEAYRLSLSLSAHTHTLNKIRRKEGREGGRKEGRKRLDVVAHIHNPHTQARLK